MNKAALPAFLDALDKIAQQSPSYRLGGDGSDGTCDCIGLIIGALKRIGIDWNGIHGSNWAARNAVKDLSPIRSADGLVPGAVVFKVRSPGESGYSLPERYQDHPDRLDYYHVGVVRRVFPLQIIHCTTPGIRTDTSAGAWAQKGQLTLISQEDVLPLCKALVTAPSGSTVNLRREPQGDLLVRVPVGETVTVDQSGSEWSRITWHSYTGWMKSVYLSVRDETPQINPPSLQSLQARLDLLEERVTALEEAAR